MDQQPAGQPYLIEGFSQSAQIAIDEKLELIASGNPPPDVTFLLLGSGNRPDGGFLERFAGLVIPGATGFDFNGAEPTDAGITTIDIANQYDGNADFPQYPVNVVADLNALLGFIYQHAGYGIGPLPYPVPAIWPPSDPLPPLSGPYRRRIRARLNGCRQAGRRRHHVLLHPDHRPAAAGPAAQPGRARTRAQHLPAGPAGRRRSRLRPIHPIRRPDTGRADPHPGPGDVHPRIHQRRRPGRQQRLRTLRRAAARFRPTGKLLRLGGGLVAARPSGCPTTRSSPSSTPTSTRSLRSSIVEAPIGTGIQNLLDLTGIQQDLLDPVLGLVGSLGGLFTS